MVGRVENLGIFKAILSKAEANLQNSVQEKKKKEEGNDKGYTKITCKNVSMYECPQSYFHKVKSILKRLHHTSVDL